MSNEMLIALFSLLGTIIGTFGGITTSAKLMNYRLEQLEKKVEKHNNFAEELPLLKLRVDELEEEVHRSA